jgi:signal peptidase II
MNPGVAFSFPIQGVFAIVLTIIIIVVLLYYYLHHVQKTLISSLVFGFILGGALGNLLDRFFYGAVVDYIRIYSYPAFNIADMAITVGFLLFVIYLDRMSVKKFSRF